MDLNNGCASQHLSNGGITNSVLPQTDIYTTPCVIQNSHEISVQGKTSVSPIYSTIEDLHDKDVHSEEKEHTKIEITNFQGKRLGLLSRASAAMTWALETAYFKVGLFVGEFPVTVIICLIVMCGLCGLGMKTFSETQEQVKLWVPQTSRLIQEKDWVDRTFPQETRFVSILAIQKEGNILTRDSINALLDFYIESLQLRVNGRTFLDMCVRVGQYCYVSSLLELWWQNETVIRSLSTSDIISAVNKASVSPVSGVDVKTLLGGDLSFDEHGVIISAEATQITWVLKKESDNSDASEFEKLMIEKALKGHPGMSNSYVYASRSFDDEGIGAINSDIKRLSIGFSIVFVFVMLSLGKFNLLEQKIYVSLAGMLCVGLSILSAYGLATSFGVMYSPIQSIMPFLLLGVGVDDMFVVIETWKNLSPEEENLDVPKKLAVTLSRAGVSITVTSLTDIVAFGISATTAIPALSSFCIYATIGIFTLYVLVSTVFAGVLALDERRRRSGRDACLICYRHGKNYTPNNCSTGRSFLQKFFGTFYGPILTKLPVKIIIILVSFTLASLGLWRFIHMKQDFDLTNYIPSTSYAYSYVRAKRDYFDREGVDTVVYCGSFNYFEERHHLEEMHRRISKSPYIQSGTMNSWFTTFMYALQLSGYNITSEDDFNKAVFMFLQTPFGQRFASFVKFNSTVEPVSILASYITMRHARQPDSAHDVKSMEDMRNIIDSSGLPRFNEEGMPEYKCFAYAADYMSYETNKVLQEELYRNLGMSAAAVFLVTLLLIAHLWTSLLVFLCVMLTIVDVGGALEVWGVTIDTASSILLTLSVGLAVDYSAHIGHTFMTINGTRNNRMLVTLKTIGPAVFNGGFSTFLAFSLLADSSSYGFQLFFRVFFTVVLFGLFHGLAFLPVILSLIGARAYKHSDEIPQSIAMEISTQDSQNQPAQQPVEKPVLTSFNKKLQTDIKVLNGATVTSNCSFSREDTDHTDHLPIGKKNADHLPGGMGSTDYLPGGKENTKKQLQISVINQNMVHQTQISTVYVNEGFESADL